MKNEEKKTIQLKKNEIITLTVLGLVVIAFMVYMLSQNLSTGEPTLSTAGEATEAVTEAGTETTTEAVVKINETITPEEAVALFGEGGKNITDKEVYLIDVRTVEEYAEGHIPMSLNLPLDKLESILSIIPYADRTIVVYCRSGNRSAQAAELLGTYGYNKIYDLGGIASWPFETTK